MNMYTYPKYVSYGAYRVGSYSGTANNAGFAGNAFQSWTANTSEKIIAEQSASDPNGLKFNYELGTTNKYSAKASCNGGNVDGYGRTIYIQKGQWVIGKGGTTINQDAGVQGAGGDLFCLDPTATGYVYNNADGVTYINDFMKGDWPIESVMGTSIFAFSSTTQTGSTTQLANGYFTGPPTYKTTGNKWAFKIKNKTSLQWSNYVTDITILVDGPDLTQKSMPEHFLWVAGGVNLCPWAYTRPAEIAVGFYDFRADFDNISGGLVGYYHPNYRKLNNALKLTMSKSLEEFTLKGQSYPYQFDISEAVYQFYPNSGTTRYKYIGTQASTNDAVTVGNAIEVDSAVWIDNDDDNNDPWPIIDTVQISGNKQMISTTFGGLPNVVALDSRPVITFLSEADLDYYLSTTLGRYETDYNVVEYSSYNEGRGTGGDPYEARGSGYRKLMAFSNGFAITEKVEFGFIKREHYTSQRGYYFTDPDVVYKCATGVGTDYDIDTFLCHDATCIDIKKYANASVFQTAKTFNNSLVSAKLKNPRSTTKAMSDTISLESIQPFSTNQMEITVNLNNMPIFGYPKYKKNEYGEDASYTYSGFGTSNVGETATRLFPKSNTFFSPYGAYVSPAYTWFYNPYQNLNRI